MYQRFSADLKGLDECQAFVDANCESPRPKIIMDEIVSNIVRCSGAHDFDVEFRLDEAAQLLTLIISDDGREFNPLKVEDPDITASAGERDVGGLGIFMVRKMSRTVEYARRDGRNVLTVVMSV